MNYSTNLRLPAVFLSALTLILLSACSSTPDTPEPEASTEPQSQLPEWVRMPAIEGGFADTQCVGDTAAMNILKSKATSLARAEIARQIDIQVKAMDKTYDNLTDSAAGSSSGSTFEAVSKQVTEQQLAGSRVSKLDYVDFPDGSKQLCVMVTLSPDSAQAIYKGLIAKSGKQISATNEAILFQEFKAYKAQQELEKETSGL